MSVIANMVAAHGGLIVYVPKAEGDARELLGEKMRAVREFEPKQGDKNSPWLKGRRLLKRSGQGALSINYRVARLMLRAAILDGAIVLCKPLGNILAFSQRLSHTAKEATGAGTKRMTASAFVSEMGEWGNKEALAVVISADGPVSVRIFDAMATRVKEFGAFKEEECLE